MAELSARLTLDGSNFNGTLRDAARETSQFRRDIGGASRSVGDFGRQCNDSTKNISQFISSLQRGDIPGIITSVQGLTTAFKALSKAAVVVGAVMAIKELATAAVSAASEVEDLKTAFETMTGSAKIANDLMQQIKEYGGATPFSTGELAETAKMLLTYNVAAEDTIGVMKQIGDIAMGDAAKMQNLARAFGKTNSMGKMTGEVVESMITAGFNPLQVMCDATGLSMEEMRKRMSSGVITFNHLQEAMKIATSEGGQFYQGAEKGSQTLSGLWSTCKDNFTEILRIIGEMLIPYIKKVVEAMTEMARMLQDLKPLFDAIIWVLGVVLDYSMQMTKIWVKSIGWLIGKLKEVYGWLAKIVKEIFGINGEEIDVEVNTTNTETDTKKTIQTNAFDDLKTNVGTTDKDAKKAAEAIKKRKELESRMIDEIKSLQTMAISDEYEKRKAEIEDEYRKKKESISKMADDMKAAGIAQSKIDDLRNQANEANDMSRAKKIEDLNKKIADDKAKKEKEIFSLQKDFANKIADLTIGATDDEVSRKQLEITKQYQAEAYAIEELRKKMVELGVATSTTDAAIKGMYDQLGQWLEQQNKALDDLKRKNDAMANDKTMVGMSTKTSKLQQELELKVVGSQEWKDTVKEISKLEKEKHIVQMKMEWEGLDGFEKFQEGYSMLESNVGAIDGVVGSIESLSKSIEDGANGWEIFTNVIRVGGSILQAIGSIMQTVTTISKIMTATDTANTIVEVSNSEARASANMAEVGTDEAKAMAGATASGSSLPFPANLAAIAMGIAAVVAAIAMIASIGSYANGGIIGGASRIGDHNFARVNAGEMILNGRQQNNLFEAIDKNRLGSQQVGGDVEFRITGDTLYGVLKNHSKLKGTVGKNIGIG